jgi:hypothetical protein
MSTLLNSSFKLRKATTGFIECASGPSRLLSSSVTRANHYDKLKVSKTATRAQVKAKFYEVREERMQAY